MAPQRDFGPTYIARQNADVLITVGRWLARLVFPVALVCFTVATVVGLHNHVAVTPSLWPHHLGAGYATVSIRHLIVTLLVTLFGMMLESFVFCREAFARGEPATAIQAVLTTARRLFLGTWCAELPVVSSPAPLAASRVAEDPGGGILRQLRSALSTAPVGPPAHLALSSDPRGPFAQSGHRAEVLVVA